MPSGTDLGKLVLRQSLHKAAVAVPKAQMTVTDGNSNTINIKFVPKTAITPTGFSLVGVVTTSTVVTTSLVSPLSGDSTNGWLAKITVTGTPTVGGKYKLYAIVSGVNQLTQPSTILTYDELFGWSPVKKSSSVQNLEVKGDTVFGISGTNSLAQFRGSGLNTTNATVTGALILKNTLNLDSPISRTVPGPIVFQNGEGVIVNWNLVCDDALTCVGTASLGRLVLQPSYGENSILTLLPPGSAFEENAIIPTGTSYENAVYHHNLGNKLFFKYGRYGSEILFPILITIYPDPILWEQSGGSLVPYALTRYNHADEEIVIVKTGLDGSIRLRIPIYIGLPVFQTVYAVVWI
jgi:hypothetical protein